MVIKISELPPIPSIGGTEEAELNDGGVSRRGTTEQIKDYIENTISTSLDGIVIGTGGSPLTAKKSEFSQVIDPLVTDDSSLGYDVGSRWLNTTLNKEFVCLDNSVGSAVWQETTVAAAGEVNTASNQGAAGVGFFDNKNGVDLEFRNLNVVSNKLSVALDGPNKEVDIDVVEANLDLGNMGGTVGTSQISDNSVTYAKIQDTTSANILLGSGNAGPGDPEEITVGTNLTMTGTTLSADTQSGTTNLGYIASAVDGTVTSDTGTDATLPLVVAAGDAGLMTGADKTKLDGVAVGATANSTDAFLLDRANHTGTQTLSTISDSGALAALDTVDTAEIVDGAVTPAKIQDLTAGERLLGRGDSGPGDVQELTISTGLDITGTVLSAPILGTIPAQITQFNSLIKTPYGADSAGTNAATGISFILPTDFSSMSTLEVHIIPDSNFVGIDIDIFIGSHNSGQLYTTNLASDTTSTYNFTLDTGDSFDLLSLFNTLPGGSLIPGARIGISLEHQAIGGAILYIGTTIEYIRS